MTGSRRKRAPAAAFDALLTPERRSKPGYSAQIEAVPAGEGETFGTVRLLRVADQTPCDLLRAKRLISEEEYRAAGRLWRNWYRSGVLSSVTVSYAEGIRISENAAGMPASEAQAHHRQRFRAAAAELMRAGRLTATYTLAIVLDDRAPEEVGRQYSGRRQAQQARAVAIDRLREGLAVLARHYGLVR
jgi:hypothetical protein